MFYDPKGTAKVIPCQFKLGDIQLYACLLNNDVNKENKIFLMDIRGRVSAANILRIPFCENCKYDCEAKK